MPRKGTGETALKKGLKHAEVVRLRLAGRSWPEIAEQVGLAERTCHDAWTAWVELDKKELMGEDPIEVVQEQLAGFRQLRADAGRVFDEAAGFIVPVDDGRREVKVAGNASARVGALRLIADLRQREIGLRQETGLLPKNLGRMQVEIDVRHWTEEIIRVFQRHDVPPEAMDEVYELLAHDPQVRALTAGRGGNGDG